MEKEKDRLIDYWYKDAYMSIERKDYYIKIITCSDNDKSKRIFKG